MRNTVTNVVNPIQRKSELVLRISNTTDRAKTDVLMLPSDNSPLDDIRTNISGADTGIELTAKGFGSSAEVVRFFKKNCTSFGNMQIGVDAQGNLDNGFVFKQQRPHGKEIEGSIDFRTSRVPAGNGDFQKIARVPAKKGGFVMNRKKDIYLERLEANSYMEFTIEVSGWDYSPQLAPIVEEVQ